MVFLKWVFLSEIEGITEVKIVLMWIILKNVFYSMYLWEGFRFIASVVGKSVRLYLEIELCINFEEVKVFVNVNMIKFFLIFYRFRLKSGINVDIEFSYFWLLTKCSFCKIWGYNDIECFKCKL